MDSGNAHKLIFLLYLDLLDPLSCVPHFKKFQSPLFLVFEWKRLLVWLPRSCWEQSQESLLDALLSAWTPQSSLEALTHLPAADLDSSSSSLPRIHYKDIETHPVPGTVLDAEGTVLKKRQ